MHAWNTVGIQSDPTCVIPGGVWNFPQLEPGALLCSVPYVTGNRQSTAGNQQRGFFPIPRPSMAHYDIFRDQLGIKYPAFGHALWEPNPGRLYTPVEVGDVGFIREGKFHRLFNVLLPAEHPSHERFGVPEHYEPLLPGVADHIDSGKITPNDFCSFGVHVSSGGLEIFASEYSNHTSYISS